MMSNNCITGDSRIIIKDNNNRNFDTDIHTALSQLDLFYDKDKQTSIYYPKNRIKVLTTDRFAYFEGIIDCGISNDILSIRLTNHTELKCSPTKQIYKDLVKQFVDAKHLFVGDICTNKIIVSIKQDRPARVYNLINLDRIQSFLANDISVSSYLYGK